MAEDDGTKNKVLAAFAAIASGVILLIGLLFIWNIWVGLIALALTLIFIGWVALIIILD